MTVTPPAAPHSHSQAEENEAVADSSETTRWQPMETAPRDGSEVLGWARVGWVDGGGLATASDERRRVVMHWSAFARQIDIEDAGAEGEWLLKSATPYSEVADPGLWSPLLEEPAHG